VIATVGSKRGHQSRGTRTPVSEQRRRPVGVILVSLLFFSCLQPPGSRKGESIDTNLRPDGFVSLTDIDSTIELDIRYRTSNNFVGRPIAGYRGAKCILTREAAAALVRAQKQANERGYSLKVYDCYRPRRAVADFVAWAEDAADTRMRLGFYPSIAKNELFARGYIAEKSGHSRGSTVDLTLISLSSPRPQQPEPEPDDCRRGANAIGGTLDMGTAFDCFDERAHTDHTGISHRARVHRDLLRRAMLRRGFSAYAKEWWHFTLGAEPFPHRYFDFEVR